ncbi:HLA class III protein Dom3z [Histoplasma capsulatum G186AR]|uniref:Decapping nuclease n=1 Tax=Ajellomyces capsulatus (strain G186AR / H82 / ATCC MYA-2454 / RMSCC 2432) TaxID=447093 RepID=C0P181_AJECG|nr:HLA class III protein Dom3z [Histoplasma capsulatum G186AR]EEH02596.1 HLA class III protein Dom3z [Histoplasma capsulatum G186AR]
MRIHQEIAYFSYDDQHNFHLDESSLRYYYPPRLPVDLKKGFDTFEKLDDTGDEHLDALLETIIDLEKRTGAKCEADLITWRGMMTKFHLSPPFRLLCQNTIGDRMKQYQFSDRNVERAQCYKFETLSLLDQPWDATPREKIEGREDQVVNNKAQYCSIVRTGIGGCKLVIGGEVDAVWDSKPDRKEDPINWVELKTSAEIRNDRDMFKYERKLLKFWAQSFLLGVPKIIVGFRDEHGILHRLEEMVTRDIPGLVARQGKGTWDGNICINFTAKFLEWLKLVIKDEEGLWRIRRQEKSPVIEVFKLEDSGHGGILSQAFVDWRSSK